VARYLCAILVAGVAFEWWLGIRGPHAEVWAAWWLSAFVISIGLCGILTRLAVRGGWSQDVLAIGLLFLFGLTVPLQMIAPVGVDAVHGHLAGLIVGAIAAIPAVFARRS
jgi:hypothetical protein